MGERQAVDPKKGSSRTDSPKTDMPKQFSKRLAWIGAVYWIVFLSSILVLMFLQPDTATACIYLVLIVTVNKMVDTWAYTKNSTYEKGLINLREMTKMELTLGGAKRKEKSESEEEGNG